MADPNQRSEPETEESEVSEGEALPQEPKATKPKKKAKSEGEPEPVKDRNQRIREEAAAKRRNKRESEERRAVAARNLDTGEIVDDALARSTHAAASWLKRNFNIVQWTILVGIVAAIGYQVYKYRHGVNAARVTDELSRAVQDQHARIGSGDSTPDRYTGLSDTRPTFADESARLKAAAASYTKAESNGSATTSALAALGLGGVLFDQGKYKEARAQYEKVKGSVLSTKDPDAKARSIEGIGLSYEAEENLDSALTAFKELGNNDSPALAALGEYHQARLLAKKNQLDAAKALLKKASERLSKLSDPEKKGLIGGSGFLDQQVKQLLGMLDPSSVPKSTGLTAEQLKGLQSQLQLSGNEKIDQKKLQEVLKKLGESKGQAPAPVPAPAPAPAGSAP